MRGVVRCEGCGERLLVANDPAPRPTNVRRAIGGTTSVVAGAAVGMGVAIAAVVSPIVALGLVAAVPLAAGGVGLASRIAQRRRERAFRARERPAPPPDETLADARQALAADPHAIVTVRGRVHLEIPVVEGTNQAVARGAVGRFVVFASDGEALVDDDRVDVPSDLVVKDGALVEVVGPARLIADDATGDYRVARSRIVFSATGDQPLRLRAI